MNLGDNAAEIGEITMKSRSVESEFEVLVPDEIAQFLRVSLAAVEEEISSGRLHAVSIGGEWRVMRKDFDQFLRGGKVINSKPKGQYPVTSQISFAQTAPFAYRWPDTNVEQYDDAYVGTAGGKKIVIGFITGIGSPEKKSRRKAVVFVDSRPMVRFKAADDFDRSALMLSVIKMDDRKQLRPDEPVPAEYSGFRIESYRLHINESHISKNMALVCEKDDFQTMAAHALIRAKQIEDRKQ